MLDLLRGYLGADANTLIMLYVMMWVSDSPSLLMRIVDEMRSGSELL